MLKLVVSLLTRAPNSHVACFAQYVANLLMPAMTANVNENDVMEGSPEYKMIQLRNQALYWMINETFSLDGAKLNTQFCTMLQQAIGFDWILLFLCDPKISEKTVVAAFRLLTVVLLSPTGMPVF